MITEKIFKFKTLSQFVCINAYVRSFIPIIWAPKCLQIKKCSIQKLLKISKPTPLLYNKILFYILKGLGSAAIQAIHVASGSRPSDWPNGGPRSSKLRLFCKKTPHIQWKSIRSLTSSLMIFYEKSLGFHTINPQSIYPGLRKFTKKPLSFHKINSSSFFSLRNFYRKNLLF